MTQRRLPNLLFIVAVALGSVHWLGLSQTAQAARSIVFPVAGTAQFSNDFNAGRSNGVHGATDIFAPKLRPLLAAVDGTVSYVGYPQPSWGYSVYIKDADNYTYRYLHINNDTPGTDDGNGGPTNAYAPDMKVGNPVVKGQQIGWLGDSGNAETTTPHLHFEILEPGGAPINPYDSLIIAEHRTAPTDYPQLAGEMLPYGSSFTGGINIARGNIDGDIASETVTGAGQGGGPHVRIFDDNDTAIGGFFAYAPTFGGGVDVAMGDVDGDGIDEIITAAGPGGGPHVRIFEVNGQEIGGFYAYSPNFTGGVRVATADIDGNGTDEIITGALSGGGPHVRVMRLNGTEVLGFYAFAPNFLGGVDVAGGDVVGTAADEIIVAAGPGGGPHVRVLNGNGTEAAGFFAYGTNFTGGVRLSAGNLKTSTAKAEIVTVPATGGGPHTRMFDGTGAVLSEMMFLETWWNGPYDVAGGYDSSKAAAGTGRRATVRPGLN